MNSFVDDEDPLELRDSGSEDEENDEKSLFSATPKTKGQTMADLFQEAFNVDSEGALFPRSKHVGIGYHGRLQRVTQREKDRHTELLRQLQTGLSLNEQSKCLDVQILSRYLDAKLTVCHCILVEITKGSEYDKSTQEFVDEGEMSKRTIIFNSRLCADVGLEVGNVIHIHPPWMEVQTMENERIILVTYFSPG
ncbi:hypothetical protein QJS04_geneDACA002899 [Acorus gramineus]|uniref:Uncharacterized protein n=1 Tax=Acorus gramineus TaxID=55184 RepID=A0AAV9BW66_ACOGR|nr:hypothetical protein QJS04_geneDACA002899 [Acorus gramineus]